MCGAIASTTLTTAPRLLSKVVIPIPKDLKEQHSISVTISDIEELILQFQTLIEKKKNIKKGAMQELLTGKRRLEGFNDEWEIKKFEEIFLKTPTKNFQIKKSEYQNTGKYPIVDQGKQQTIRFSDRTDKVFPCPENGIIIFGDHTRILKFIDYDFVIGADGTQILTTIENNIPNFFYYQLQTKFIPNTGYNRHFKFLKEHIFYKPKFEEQKAISQILSDMDSEIEQLEKKCSKYKKIKKGMMQKLLTGEIRLN